MIKSQLRILLRGMIPCRSSVPAPDNFLYFVHSTLDALSEVEQNIGSWQELGDESLVELRVQPAHTTKMWSKIHFFYVWFTPQP